MTMPPFFQSKRNLIRLAVFLLLGIGIFAGMFYYVNTYLYKFFASTGGENMITVDTQQSRIKVNTNSPFNIAVELIPAAGRRFSAAELYFKYDSSNFDYKKELSGVSGFSQVGSFFENPLIETVTDLGGNEKKIKLVMVSYKSVTFEPIQFYLSFQSKNEPGVSQITFLEDKSKIVGIVDDNGQAQPARLKINVNNGTNRVVVASNQPVNTPTLTPTVTPTDILANCSPQQTSPINNQIVEGKPTLLWTVCENVNYYRVRLNGGGINWMSHGRTGNSYTMSAFTFRPGNSYEWYVQACADQSCGRTTAWSQVETFRSPASPTPTPTLTLTPTSEPTATQVPPTATATLPPEPTADTCPKFAFGDANCDGKIYFEDFTCWREEFVFSKLLGNCRSSDFDSLNGVGLLDFTIWKINFLKTQVEVE